VSLVGRKSVPSDGFLVIFVDATAEVIAQSKIVLGRGVPLSGGESVPTHRFKVILGHPSAGDVETGKIELGSRVPLFRAVSQLA
jgi:hypothetical protein